MAEAGIRGAQRVLAQNAALRVHDGEGRIVADRTDIAEMIGHALKLGHQGAQIDRARGHLRVPGLLDRMRKGERIGDGAVAGRAAGETECLVERRARHERLDAFVHIAQALFQPHHGFSVGRETEMPGFDDAGMHRSDRNLVQAFALRGQESIGGGGSRRGGRGGKRMRYSPEAEIEPRPCIRQADRLQAEQAADCAFQPYRRRVARADRGKSTVGTWHAHDEHDAASL